MSNNFRDESRKDWVVPSGKITESGIKVGCLQRIADSLEKIEQPYLRLLNDIGHLHKRNKEQNAAINHLNLRIASLQGVITRMKSGIRSKPKTATPSHAGYGNGCIPRVVKGMNEQ